MSRAHDVLAGILCIGSLWLWIIASSDFSGKPTWFVIMAVLGKLYLGWLITVPVYREYLK